MISSEQRINTMSIYRFAGATLMLAGLIDRQRRRARLVREYVDPKHDVLTCPSCRSAIRRELRAWLLEQFWQPA